MVRYPVAGITLISKCTGGGGQGGGRSAFATTNALVLFVPVFLLTPHAAVRRVPATVVHGLLLTVEALKHSTQ